MVGNDKCLGQDLALDLNKLLLVLVVKFYRLNSSYGKVMFSQVSVHQEEGCVVTLVPGPFWGYGWFQVPSRGGYPWYQVPSGGVGMPGPRSLPGGLPQLVTPSGGHHTYGRQASGTHPYSTFG